MSEISTEKVTDLIFQLPCIDPTSTNINEEDSKPQQSMSSIKKDVIDNNNEDKGLSPTLHNRTALLQSLMELKQCAILFSAEAYAEASDNLNYSLAQQKNYASKNSSNSQIKSDIEIQHQIQDVIDGTQESFMEPFMTASQKMTDYYNAISSLRDVISSNVTPKKDDDKGQLHITSDIYVAIKDFIKEWGGAALYPTDGSGVSKAEAEDWCAKMGVGKVISSGDEYKVVIDQSPLEDILKVFSPYDNTSWTGIESKGTYTISQTVYNNLMSSVDTFLQKEQGKMNKIINQLDYYNKLISQLQERLTDFAKQMADVALNFLRV